MKRKVDFADAFRKYWNRKGHYYTDNNPGRTVNNICKWLDACETVEDIENHILSMRTRRESTRKLIVDFLDDLQPQVEFDCTTILAEKVFYDSVLERRLEIAKYLHEPHTPAEIRERFDIGEERLKKDLKALKEGLEAFGTNIELEELKKGRKRYYKATVHPIFLALNLTEVYAMTEYLQRNTRKNDPNAMIVKSVIDRIKAQLSDYAWEKLYNQKKPNDLGNYYLSDDNLASSREGIRMYIEKSGSICKFFYNGKAYYGTIDRSGRIRLENGEYLDVDPKNVEFVIESLQYK